MKILQISPYFPPYVGGQEKYIFYLSRVLVRMGHQVTVLISNYPANVENESLEGINVIRHACFGRPLRNPISPGIFLSTLKYKDFDIIHTHNEHSLAANLAVLAKYMLKIPLVITSHGNLTFNSPVVDFFREVYWRSFRLETLKGADRVVVATPSEKRRLENKSKKLFKRIKIAPESG